MAIFDCDCFSVSLSARPMETETCELVEDESEAKQTRSNDQAI